VLKNPNKAEMEQMFPLATVKNGDGSTANHLVLWLEALFEPSAVPAVTETTSGSAEIVCSASPL
jgi:hypothetical protein